MVNMMQQDLLTLDTNKLFEERTIPEIQEVLKRIKNEIERKRQDLRIMVGERYRDLIEAADTISAMKSSSEIVILHIHHMETLCHEIKQKNYSQIKNQNFSKTRSVKYKKYYVTSLQINFLMDIPEKVWSCIDQQDYLQAVLLYFFAQHIYTGLNVESGNQSSILVEFPIVTKQWAVISQFHDTIMQACLDNLKISNLTIELSLDCMISLLFLQRMSMTDAYTMFLQARKETVKSILHTDNFLGGVKTQICQVVDSILQTMHLIHVIFVEGHPNSPCVEGMLMKKINSVVNDDAMPIINMLHMSSLWKKHLPPIIQEYRPFLDPAWVPIPPSELCSRATEWLSSIKSMIESKVQQLISYVDTMKGLASIRDKVYEFLEDHPVQKMWIELCQHVLAKRFELWKEFFHPLLSIRAKAIMDTHLESAMDSLRNALQKTAKEVQKEWVPLPENDLHWFIWYESENDLPHRAGWMSANRAPHQAGGLMMKTKGYTPRIQNLCHNFDMKLKSLLEDLFTYVGKEEDSPLVALNCPFKKYQDKDILHQHLQIKMDGHIERLLLLIHKEAFESVEPSNKHKEQGKLVLLARFCAALCDLCPHMHKGIAISSVDNEQNGKANPEHSSSLLLRKRFDEESLNIYQVWKASIVKKVMDTIQKANKDLDLNSFLEGIAEWETVDITEETQEGNTVKSTIRIPSHISLALSSALFSICQEVNKIGPHVIPRKISDDLIRDVSDMYIEHIDNLLKNRELFQVQAVQLIFDVKFIAQLFVLRENKELLSRIQCIVDHLEKFVDPFDLDVFTAPLQMNLKKAIHTSQLVFGILIPCEKIPLLSLYRPVNPTVQHNLLSFAPTGPWFPLLALSNTKTIPVVIDGPNEKEAVVVSKKGRARKSHSSPKPKRDSSPSNRTMTSSFFGVSSWFGT